MDIERDDLKKMLNDSKVNGLTKKSVEEIRDSIDKKLEAINAVYGLNLKVGRIRFNNLEMKLSIAGHIQSTEDGESGEKAAFIQTANIFYPRVSISDLNLIRKYGYGFRLPNEHEVYRINRRAKKFHIQASNSEHTEFSKCTFEYLLDLLKSKYGR